MKEKRETYSNAVEYENFVTFKKKKHLSLSLILSARTPESARRQLLKIKENSCFVAATNGTWDLFAMVTVTGASEERVTSIRQTIMKWLRQVSLVQETDTNRTLFTFYPRHFSALSSFCTRSTDNSWQHMLQMCCHNENRESHSSTSSSSLKVVRLREFTFVFSNSRQMCTEIPLTHCANNFTQRHGFGSQFKLSSVWVFDLHTIWMCVFQDNSTLSLHASRILCSNEHVQWLTNGTLPHIDHFDIICDISRRWRAITFSYGHCQSWWH